MEEEKIQKEMQLLRERIDVLENKPIRIDRYLDNQSKDIIEDIIRERIFDITWNDYFYYSNYFESFDGWSGLATVSSIINRLFLRTSTTQDNVAYVNKKATKQASLSFDFESRFRSSFDAGYTSGSGTLTDVKVYVGTGHSITGGAGNLLEDGLASNDHYGFYLEDDILYGITSNGSSYSTVQLLSGIEHFDSHLIEARHYPGEKVVFYVSDATSGIFTTQLNTLKERGTLTTNLPTGHRDPLAQFAVQNTNASAEDREIDIGFVEIIQRK